MLFFSFDSHINATTMFYCDYYENILRSRKHIKTYRVFKINIMFVEKHIPGCNGYFARTDGTIRFPNGYIQKLKPTSKGYQTIWHNGMCFHSHRLIALAFVHNPIPTVFVEVDHIDCDPSNNKPSNLRWLTHQLNGMNRKNAVNAYKHKVFKNGKYRFSCWQSKVTVQGVSHIVGHYKTKEEASRNGKEFKQKAFDRIYQEHIDAAKKNGTYVPFPHELINEAPRTGSYILGF